MNITIKREKGNVAISESKGCEEHDVVNAYAVALAIKCGSMFKKKEMALFLLELAYAHSKEILDQMYDK